MSHGGIYITNRRYSDIANAFNGTEEDWNKFVLNKKIYLKDTILRNAYYPAAEGGIYKSEVVIAHGGQARNCYIGNSSSIGYGYGHGSSVYMDNCTFENGNPCVRYAELSPNRLFVSNTKFTD